MASTAVQLELEEGEIDEVDERVARARLALAIHPGGVKGASTRVVKLEVDAEANVEDSDGVVILASDDDDDCVVTYEKPAARAVANSVIPVDGLAANKCLPRKRRRSGSPTNAIIKKRSNKLDSVLAMAIPAGYERQVYKLPSSTTKQPTFITACIPVSVKPSRMQEPIYKARLREASMRKSGAPLATPSRGFYRSRYSASQPWRSRTRTSMAGRPRTPSKGNQHKVRSAAREKPPSISSSRCSVEPSYEDLLAQYRRIQSQLEDLSKEDEDEDDENTGVTLAEVDRENDGDKANAAFAPTTEDVNKENVISDNEYIELRGSDAKNEKTITRWDKQRPRRVSSRSSSGHKKNSSKSKAQNKEEDDDELELRRIALASAFRRTPRKGLSENIGLVSDVLGRNCEELSNEVPETRPTSPVVKDKKMLADDDDEDILRALLLSSLSNKQLEKNTKLGSTAGNSPALLLPAKGVAFSNADETPESDELLGQTAMQPKSTASKTLPSLFVAPPLPIHDPVVISLKDDTDSEPEDSAPVAPPKTVSLISTIDSFLNEVRQKVELSKQEKQIVPINVPTTPTAVLSLPSPELEEYRRLKAEIQKREGKFMSKPASAVRQVSKETITVTVLQNSSTPKTVVVRHSSPEANNAAVRARFKACEAKLKQHGQEMLDCQRELQRLKLQVNAKEAVIKSADLKISQLREQLAAAEKVADAQRKNLEAVKQRHEGLAKDVESMKLEKQKLQSECLAYGKRLYGESFQMPHSLRIIGVRRKSVTSNSTSSQGAKKKRSETQRKVLQPASAKRLKVNNHEMIRLKAMEQEISLKLQELRRRANKTITAEAENVVATSASNSPANVERRRRSFLEKNQSTKPHISQVPIGSAVTSADTAAAASAAVVVQPLGGDQLIEAACSIVHFTDLQIQAAKQLLLESINNFSLSRANSVPLNSYEIHFAFPRQKSGITGIKMAENLNTTEVGDTSDTTSAVIGPYSSALLHCRTYRFSPYFRTKANQCLTWPTYVHKLLPRKILCRFELTGTCNDDECLGQHIRDYTMTPKEVLCDIVSYCPQLTGVSDGTSVEECRLKIEAYVEKLLSSNLDRMTHDQLCILTVGRVNEALGKAPPHYITFEERRWRPAPDSDDAFDVDYEPVGNRKRNIFSRGSRCDEIIPDEVVGEGDARFFSMSDEAADALEFAVLKSPTDANLWLRLAYTKLDGRGRSADVSLDMALNVLSRGLEENLHNKDLWLHYLSLYSKRKEREDLLSLCEQAIGFCPCYEVWWKYLQESRIFTSKRETCKAMLDFVLKSDVDPQTKSRQILEVLLYDVQLNILSGRFEDGKKILEVALEMEKLKASSETDLFQCLVDVDKCVLWLCYIHVVEFQWLPNSLFDPANSGPGRVVCTTPFLLPWRQGRNFRTSVSHVRKLIMVALRKCVRKGQSATANAQVCLPLYRNLMALEISRNKHQLAVSICRQLLETAPTDEVFVLLAGMFYNQEDSSSVTQTFNEAIKISSSSPLVHYFAAAYELSTGNTKSTCNCVGHYVATFFELSDESEADNNVDRAEEMYSQLLGRAITPSTTAYPLKVSKSDVSKRKPYLWLSYCIWLEALSRHTDVVEAYEAAIVQMLSIVDLQIVWLRYLQYTLKRITVSESTTERDFGHYTNLVRRCLTSVPCLIAPFPGSTNLQKSRSDYSFFNRIVDSYVHVLPESRRIRAYQSFCSLAPENAALARTLLELYFNAGQYREAWSLAKSQLEYSPRSWDFWKVAIYLAKRMKRPSVVRMLYEDAIDALPFNIEVWQEFIVFELANDRRDNAARLLNRCRQARLNVDRILDQGLVHCLVNIVP